jgi:hypothetical protein
MEAKLRVLVAVCVVTALAAASARAQCAGGAGAQTGLASVSCSGIAAWSGSATYVSGAKVVYNNCLYQTNQAFTSNAAWCPGCSGVYLYGNSLACPAAGCHYGAQGPCSGTSATATATAATRATATATARSTPRATATANPRATATPTSSGAVTTTGTINFHLLLGVSNAQDHMVLDGGNYNDLIMSNMVAGVLYGHLVQQYYPGMQFQRDYLYGSLFGQLLQENIATYDYQASSNLIDPAAEQQAVMGVGQGGPYQINNYVPDMVSGSMTPSGHALVNFVAIQKNIGFTIAGAPSQNTKVTPPSFNNKYYGPVLTTYFHFNDFVALALIGKGPGGWTTPWQPAYDNCLLHFKTLPNNFLDVILNVAYNQGFYGGLVGSYSSLGATATSSTVASVNSYSSIWGVNDTYRQYPYQVRYYLDQIYDNPIPTTSATSLVTPANHVAFSMTTLANVFSSVYQTLAYVNGSGQYVFISGAQAQAAFSSALTQTGVAPGAILDLSNASGRGQIFSVLERATANLETNLNMKLGATTTSQL